eukprot:Nitzschia sp. Nitz4//scaffold10_size219509//132095//133330//NITZ4_001438-RA/size219509-snap-gene-0.399-mRNA-1//-1//CDS//3329532950//7327//frame0
MLLRPRVMIACATCTGSTPSLLQPCSYDKSYAKIALRKMASSGHRNKNGKPPSNKRSSHSKDSSKRPVSSHLNPDSSKQQPASVRKEGKQKQSTLSMVQPSDYFYFPGRPLNSAGTGDSTDGSFRPHVLPTIDAAALLDPLHYCKKSVRQTPGDNHGINGTDAARRLLRGKKEFILAARSLQRQPAILQGHGVPSLLFQHCIDMADALLLQFTPNAVECTFHNYNLPDATATVLPEILRIRSRDATNRVSPWPPEGSLIEEWDYHLELYLTVMERIASHLGQVLLKPCHLAEEDDDDFTSSPFLFPHATPPRWNVDILRGSYFNLHSQKEGIIPPMPIVEFSEDSKHPGHILIRIQGVSQPNGEFGDFRSPQAVTLTFDACFRSPPSR